ncbi:glycosyltransferase family 2 protein [Hydromonas duriensis]|uniref:Glycosyl transferase family 2 n=1 Tax=Hydromonas duriensis TaxID=1527608 RepID=A0A4R6Y9R4_9BURK|nr:glycosyltransferase family 2 protein [Hydromonas duriensis]TDR32192.1 glycosyl transferase family 2 [Hydromonas duriensis]
MSQVTCIIPFYNGGDTIARAIDSVIDSPACHEVIVMVDASPQPLSPFLTDAHRAHIATGKLRVIEMATNLGQAAMRNVAASLSTTPYISFLDQDDMYLPGFCEEMSDVLNRHPELAAIECGAEIVKDDKNLLEIDDPRYQAIMFSVPWNVLIRRLAFWYVGSFPVDAAFRTPLAGEDIAFMTPLRHFLQTAQDFSRRLVRHHLRDGSATDNYLNRTQVVDGRVVYIEHYENEKNGEWQAAIDKHYAKAQRDVNALRQVKIIN